jgi:hypothetical protein
MMNLSEALSNPIAAFVLRAALGSYIVWMARAFYADPLGYFRRWMPRMREQAWERQAVRGLALFCLWGGCFIVATAFATQILGLHGWTLGAALVILAAIAAYLLLPGKRGPWSARSSGDDNAERLK